MTTIQEAQTMQIYSRETEETMLKFYNTLDEKDRRRFVGVAEH